MTNEQFIFQLRRLENTFGEKNFAGERLDLIAKTVMWMDLGAFSSIVDHMIGTFRTAPLPKDFVEASRLERKRNFERDVHGALTALDTPWQKGLSAYLAKEFPGCKTLNEAVEVRKLQIQVARAKDKNYDPLKDPKWV